jgi:hypothetical protein
MDADNEFLANVDIELLVAEHNREKESLLLSLPNELIDKIYQCSDPTGRHALMHTCRQVDQWSRWLWGYSWTLGGGDWGGYSWTLGDTLGGILMDIGVLMDIIDQTYSYT